MQLIAAPRPETKLHAGGLTVHACLPTALCVLFAVLQLIALPASGFSNDSYRYDVAAREFAGQSVRASVLTANADYCAQVSLRDYRSQLLLPAATSFPAPQRSADAACRAALGTRVLPPDSPEYLRIFTTRPGYPLLAAPFVRLLGGPTGLRVTSILATAAAGACVYLLLRLLQARPRWCAAGQAGYWVSPLGAVGVRPLADGTAQLCLVVALLSVILIVSREKRRGGMTLLVGAMVALGAVKYSSASMVAAALACAGLLALLRRSQPPAAGPLPILLVSAVTIGVCTALMVALGLPSLSLSVQEMFTGHLTAPPVPDPFHRLLLLNTRLWTQWVQGQAMAPVLVAGLVLGLLGLRRAVVPVAGYVLACACTGIAAIVVHPTVYEADRLGAPLWLVAVVGVPLWLHHVTQDSAAAGTDEGPRSAPRLSRAGAA